MTPGRARLVLPLTAGAIWALCWLPTGLAPFHPLAFLMIMVGLRQLETAGQAARFGLLFGLSRYALMAHYLLVLMKFSPLGIGFYLAPIVYIAPFAVLESWGAFKLEQLLGIPRGLAFGILYTFIEYIRSLGDFSLPVDMLAHTFGTSPQWLSLTPWTGPFGLTLMIMLCAVLLDVALVHRRASTRLLGLAAAVLIWSAPVIVDAFPVPAPDRAPRLAKVAILQPVIGVKEKMDRSTRPATWARLERMTLEAAAGPDKPDLIVWPESSRPDPVTWKGSGPFRDDRMEMLARKTGIPILYGSVIARVVDNRLKALYNGAALVFPDGRQAQWYGKQRLLPLAEMVPFRKLFGIDPYAKNKTKERKSILTMLGRFVEGPEPTLFEIDGLKFGVLICYEGSYPALSRAYRNRGATALMILTNDAWWGRSAFAPWHAKMVATRARELELPVIRAANSGVSSHTDVRGRQIAATGLDERTTVRVDVSPGPLPRTFFARRGHVIPFGFMLGCFMIFPLVRRFRKVG